MLLDVTSRISTVNALTLLLLMSCAQADTTDMSFSIWPDEIGRVVRRNVGCGERPLGYTSREMANFPGNTHRLGYVSRLFRDAQRVPDETNRLARRMLDGNFERAMYEALAILGSRISLDSLKDKPAAQIVPADEKSKAAWDALPEAVRRAVEEIVRGAAGATPHLHKAFDWNAVARSAGDAKVINLGTATVYNYAAGPWLGYNSFGGSSFAALSSFQATPLGNGAAVLFSSVRVAINDLLAACKDGKIPQFDSLLLKTNAGTVRVLGPGNNTYRGTDPIVIDLGGNDQYSGRLAVPTSKAVPVGLLIDVAGSDTYDGRGSPASIACGLFGIGALFDLGGNDKYTCGDSGLGCAWHGIGLLVDTVGDDTYTGRQWCQGAAHAGVGMLIDESGNDKYFCQMESQGLGSTLGVGVLIDKAGNDRYHAYDDENGRRITFPSSQTQSHETSLSQGCGYGRRADNTDGRSLAGGVGALFDGAGDDSYYGGVFSQATGFWWSVGMLVDMGGNDKYRGVYFAQGAAAHFAIGSMIDHSGDDRYNDARVLGQTLGAARDGSVGTFVDVSGDDVYYIPKKSAGGGDMNSIGLFCDQQGADEYHPLAHSYMGTASSSNPRGDYFRNVMPTIGVFVDLDGTDRYPSQGGLKNNAKWRHESSAQLWGFGFDTQRP
jgi:hypothetical protein